MENRFNFNSITPNFILKWDYTGYKKDDANFVDFFTQKSWVQTLVTLINSAYVKFRREADLVPDTLIVSCEVGAIFNDLEYFHINDSNETLGIFERIGSLSGKYSVYVDPYLPANTFYFMTRNHAVIIQQKRDSISDIVCAKFEIENLSLMNIDDYMVNEKLIDNHKSHAPISHMGKTNREELVINDELKHVIAFYIYVGNIDEKDVEEYIKMVADKLTLSKKYKGVECLFIPTRKDYGTKSVIRII